jgi:hypothetical protein
MSGNSVKITYMILMTMSGIFNVCFAVFSPIYITPGQYWWTAFFLLCSFGGSYAFTKRVDSFGDMGKIDD